MKLGTATLDHEYNFEHEQVVTTSKKTTSHLPKIIDLKPLVPLGWWLNFKLRIAVYHQEIWDFKSHRKRALVASA
jgi:hypothetical protein